jgi:hypothetical protein
VRLLNARRAPIATSNQPSKQAESILATLDSGIYYIEVRTVGRRGSTRYNLRTSAATAEPGETTATARNLSSLLGEYRSQEFVAPTDAIDYYKFILPEISNFNANIDGLSELAYMQLYFDGLVDDGERLATGYDGNNIARTMLSGTYFLAVSPYSSSKSTQYNLFLSATPDPSNLPGDPGNRTVAAYNLGNFVGNRDMRDFVGAFDMVDYYRFSADTTRNFNANIDGLSELAYMQLYFDANNNGLVDSGERLTTGYNGNNIARTISTGNYFLEVSPYSSSNSTRYNLVLGIS